MNPLPTFSVVIRTCPARTEVLAETMVNLMRAGLSSKRVVNFQVFMHESGPSWLGAIEALERAALTSSDFVLFLEDDLDFISDFFESTALWLRDIGAGSCERFYPLAANYAELHQARGIAWSYPIDKFYGSQALAIPRAFVPILISRLRQLAVSWKSSNSFDLMLKACCNSDLLTPVPSFVQHIGFDSVLHPTRPFFNFPSWPGRDWSYVKRSSTFSSAEQHNYLSRSLCAYLAQHVFDPSSFVLDLGSGPGRWSDELRRHGLVCLAFDSTPDQPGVHSQDLLRALPDQVLGSALCLEVAEHIHPDFELDFLQHILDCTDRTLVLSWAIPGQGGNRHINEKGPDYVIGLLRSLGFDFDEALTNRAREIACPEVSWLGKSLYIFHRV